MANPESVVIDGRSYWVCAQCRYPTALGKSWEVCYAVPQPGLPNPDPIRDKQALCTDCYMAQYQLIYPDAQQPVLEDGKLHSYGPVPRGGAKKHKELPKTDVEFWQEAIARSIASGGSETVQQAYNALRQEGMEVVGIEPD